MTKATRSKYNREYYIRLKAFKETHPNSPIVQRWKENARQSGNKRMASNIEKYAESQRIIRTARLARGWRQKDLADMLGVSLQYVCHWEKGRARAPWDRLYEIMPELMEGNHIV